MLKATLFRVCPSKHWGWSQLNDFDQLNRSQGITDGDLQNINTQSRPERDDFHGLLQLFENCGELNWNEHKIVAVVQPYDNEYNSDQGWRLDRNVYLKKQNGRAIKIAILNSRKVLLAS